MSSYAKMTVAQLKAECQKAGLELTGNKAQLVARLEEGAPMDTTPSTDAAAATNTATAGRKRKAASKAAAASEPEAEESEEADEAPKKKKKGSKGSAAVAPAPASSSSSSSGSTKKATYKVDPQVSGLTNSTVHEDFDAMLNQTNIGANNNKFYRIQVLQAGGTYYVWNHWGRVSETGQHSLAPTGADVKAAITAFEKKFRDKTGNAWKDRTNFVKKSGKYDLLEMDNTCDEEEEKKLAERLDNYNKGLLNSPAAAATPEPVVEEYQPTTLKAEIAEFMSLLFDPNMFKQTMQQYQIDTAKMPLGKLSKSQIEKGYAILTDLEQAVKNNNNAEINELSSRFYTCIPHDFGRNVPKAINTPEQLQKKVELLNVLNDIEIAQTIQADSKKKAQAKKEKAAAKKQLPPNPLDEKYGSLNTDLDILDKKSKEYKMIETYIAATHHSGGPKLAEVFTVSRHDEDKRFAAHDSIENRRLLWHGTNVAVVAAILNSGLRIMPHSGGRVGKGIYLASEWSKSAGYVGPATFKGKRYAIMFLVEAALGKEHEINRDDSSLTAAPKGFDSIIARGHNEPDPAKDSELKFDGKSVTVPQGKPIPQPKWSSSSFNQSEYLIYKESQHRIRYALLFQWHY